MSAGFDSQTRRHVWVEFVVGSHPCSERFFSGYSGFSLSSKTNSSKFQFDPESEGHRFVSHNRLLSVTLVKQSRFILFIYLLLEMLRLCPQNTRRIYTGETSSEAIVFIQVVLSVNHRSC